jgi:hypothetical protein
MQFYYRRADQQFGPMQWEALVATARSGSLHSTDLVWAEGWPSWQTARVVPGLLPPAPPLPPAPLVPAKPLGADPVMRALLPVGRSGWAIAAGYLGLFSFLVVPAPLALLTGLLAVRDIKKHPEKHGLGRAGFGIVIGILGTGLLIFLLVSRA